MVVKKWSFFYCTTHIPFGQIAQSVEQRTENPCVAGSIPVLATFEGKGILPFPSFYSLL